VAVEALEVTLAATEQVKEKADCGSLLIRPAMLAVDVVCEEERLGLIAFEIAVEELSEASREKRNQLVDFVFGDGPEAFGNPEQFAQAFQAFAANSWRRFQEKRLEITRQSFKPRANAKKRCSVGL